MKLTGFRLEELLEVLQHNEIRFLQARLRKCTFTLDILANVPVEIQIMVVNYLEFPDLTTMRCVSRRWRDILHKEAICDVLMKKHLRSIYEKSITAGGNKSTTGEASATIYSDLLKPPREQSQDGFQKAAASLQAVHSGRYYSTTRRYYENPDLDHGLGFKITSQRYSHGHIAYIVNGKINLLHLESGASHFYFLPHREEIGAWELSEMYLVAAAAHK